MARKRRSQLSLVIASGSEAIHIAAAQEAGLLRRFAPLRKRFAFVAGNDGGTNSYFAATAVASIGRLASSACKVVSVE
jgi:hypothetical protein